MDRPDDATLVALLDTLADAVTRGPFVTSYLIAAVIGAFGILTLVGTKKREAQDNFAFAG